MIKTGFVHFVTLVGFVTLFVVALTGMVALLRECYHYFSDWYVYHQVRKMNQRIDKNIDHLLKDMYRENARG